LRWGSDFRAGCKNLQCFVIDFWNFWAWAGEKIFTLRDAGAGEGIVSRGEEDECEPGGERDEAPQKYVCRVPEHVEDGKSLFLVDSLMFQQPDVRNCWCGQTWTRGRA